MISIFNNVCHATPHNGYYALVGLVFFHLIFPILVYMAFFYVFYFNLCDFAIIQFRFFCLLFQQTIHHLDNRMFSSYSACHNVLHYKRERETYCRFVQRIDLPWTKITRFFCRFGLNCVRQNWRLFEESKFSDLMSSTPTCFATVIDIRTYTNYGLFTVILFKQTFHAFAHLLFIQL